MKLKELQLLNMEKVKLSIQNLKMQIEKESSNTYQPSMKERK